MISQDDVIQSRLFMDSQVMHRHGTNIISIATTALKWPEQRLSADHSTSWN